MFAPQLYSCLRPCIEEMIDSERQRALGGVVQVEPVLTAPEPVLKRLLSALETEI